ncbi:hypothetical protein [Salinimicrobium xinjiangense]|uniref:hypothetical protein n=1 Tax=Salinimicrobium xinjiangense TaxID=438596 RepID=UPI0012EC9976|nr:hypothetical protein [Salinimicrobium xinjiangense]
MFEASEENKKITPTAGGVDFVFSGGNTKGKAQPIQSRKFQNSSIKFQSLLKPNLFEASEENKKITPTARRCGFCIFRWEHEGKGAANPNKEISKDKPLLSDEKRRNL